jgi:hypothetical protein
MIMDCERCAEDLTAYLDDEVTPRRSAEIRDHLDECGKCSAEMQSLADSARFLESHAKEIPLKPEIWNNVKAQLSTMEAAQPAGFSPFWVWRWPKVTATVLATASVLALGFWGYLNYEESQESLRYYMNAYVTARDAQLHGQEASLALASANSKAGAGSQLDKADNPFVEHLSNTYHNPFRSEDE